MLVAGLPHNKIAANDWSSLISPKAWEINASQYKKVSLLRLTFLYWLRGPDFLPAGRQGTGDLHVMSGSKGFRSISVCFGKL